MILEFNNHISTGEFHLTGVITR